MPSDPQSPNEREIKLRLFQACVAADEDAFNEALNEGANVHALDCWGRNALLLLILGLSFRADGGERYRMKREVRGRMAEELLARGSDFTNLSEIDPWAKPMLHHAAHYDLKEVVVALLRAGADPEATCENGKTVLESVVPARPVSAQTGFSKSMAELLVDEGCDPFRKGVSGYTPASFFIEWDAEWAAPVLARASDRALKNKLAEPAPGQEVTRARL